MALEDDLKNSEESLKNMNKAAVEFESTVSAINQQLKNIAKEEQDIADIISVATKNNSALQKVAGEISKLKKEDLTQSKNQQKLQLAQAKFSGLQAKNAAIQAVLKDRIAIAGEEEFNAIVKTQVAMENAAESSEKVAENFEEIKNATDKINRAAKGFENMADILGSIPAIGPPLSKAFKGAAQAARDAAASGKGFAGSLAAGAAELVSIKALLALAVTSLFVADKRTTELAKNLQVSKDEAREINARFQDISLNSGKAYLNAAALSEAVGQLGSNLGVANQMSDELVKNQVFLTKQMGLSAETSAELNELAEFQGKSADKTNKEIADQVVNLQKETGIALKLDDVFEDVVKTNAGLKAAYGFNTKLIAEQVVKVKELGLSIEQSAKMASQLLEFESSIAKELEAELLTGKDLNLEQARYLALQGKSTEAAAELAKQVGGTAELSRMNVLQQEALAEAMGMERNELIQTVQKRELLAKLGKESIEDAAATEEGRRRILELGGEQLLQQYEQESAAAKFESAVIKIQEALGTMMEGPFGKFVDGLASALASGTALKGIMIGLGAIGFGRMLSSLASALALNTANASAALTTASAISFGIGLIAIVGAVAAAMSAMESNTKSSVSAMKSVSDAMIAPGGELVAAGPKGSFKFDKEDSIVAGTDLFGKKRGGGVKRDAALISKVERLITINEQLLAKDMDVNVEITGVPDVTFEQKQANNMNTYTTSVN